MSPDDTIGARFATWWTQALTRTVERDLAHDRQAEIASDVHEELTEAWHRDELAAGSRSVMARVVRGMPSDIAWRVGLEFRPRRIAWHLRNPSTLLTTLLVVMLPANVAADLSGYVAPLWAVTDFIGLCILIFGAMALAIRVRPSMAVGAERFHPRSRLERARRCLTATLGIALAGSAAFRFGALGPVGGVFWVMFVAGVLLYAAVLVTTLGVQLLTLGRYLPKMRYDRKN